MFARRAFFAYLAFTNAFANVVARLAANVADTDIEISGSRQLFH